ncbi:hypothetical protein D3C81_1729020 [compost metagenome]
MAAAGIAADVGDCRIGTDDVGEGIQPLLHHLERAALVRLHAANQDAGILLREEGFRDRDIEMDVQRHDCKQRDDGQRLVAQGPDQ